MQIGIVYVKKCNYSRIYILFDVLPGCSTPKICHLELKGWSSKHHLMTRGQVAVKLPGGLSFFCFSSLFQKHPLKKMHYQKRRHFHSLKPPDPVWNLMNHQIFWCLHPKIQLSKTTRWPAGHPNSNRKNRGSKASFWKGAERSRGWTPFWGRGNNMGTRTRNFRVKKLGGKKQRPYFFRRIFLEVEG